MRRHHLGPERRANVRPRGEMSPGIMRGPELGLRIMLRAGFGTTDAVAAWRALFSYTLGFASFSP